MFFTNNYDERDSSNNKYENFQENRALRELMKEISLTPIRFGGEKIQFILIKLESFGEFWGEALGVSKRCPIPRSFRVLAHA